LHQFRDRGAAVVGLCPQRQEFNDSLKAELGLEFPILRDHENELATAFGLTLKTPPAVIAAEQFLGLDLPAHNDSDHWDLPIPSRYVIDRTFRIRFASLHVDHRMRTDPVDCLSSMAASG